MATPNTNNDVQQELEILRRAVAALQTRCDTLEHEVQELRQLPSAQARSALKPPIDIPQEVLNVAIDHLHNDRHALKVCSLVSKAWAHAARYHLFHTWYISEKNKLSGMRLLRHRLCTFPTCLRRVVYSGEEKDPSNLQVLSWSSDSFDIAAPPSLHSLVIKHRRMDLRHWGALEDLSRFESFINNITQLHLHDVMCNPLTFITIIVQFPSLVKLKLQKITMPPDVHGVNDIELSQAIQPATSFRALEIADVDNPWAWTFIGRESTAQLDTFRIKVPSDELIVALRLAPYFKNAGTSLTTLGLRFGTVEEEVNFFQSVDLRENRKVRCLELGGLLQFDGGGFSQAYLRIHDILSIIQITAFTTLVLDVDIFDPLSAESPSEDARGAECSDEGWGALDELLAGWQLPLLEMIHFRVQRDPIYNEVIPHHLRSRLPKCSANRTIIFTYIGEDE